MSYTHSKGAYGSGGGGPNLEMAKMAMSYTGISMMMIMEDKTRKNTIVFAGFCWGVLCTVLAGFYWARVDSVMKWQSIVTKNSDTDIIAYDVGCSNGPFSDNEAAADYLKDLSDCDKDCQELGSQWSVVFLCNAVIMLLLIINFTCACFGSRIAMCRFLAAWFACCICCAHSLSSSPLLCSDSDPRAHFALCRQRTPTLLMTRACPQMTGLTKRTVPSFSPSGSSSSSVAAAAAAPVPLITPKN